MRKNKAMKESTVQYPCPLCGQAMTAIQDKTGVMVTCFNVPCDPRCHENPFGHGKNAVEAHKIACDKYRKLS
jgi:ssDNA-binding Zn-finger/Zn-ribbon topoisomerase 1